MTKTTDPKPARRPRRASLPITPEAASEIDAVAEAFHVPKSEVRTRASKLASEVVASKLREDMGRERVEAAKQELTRLQGIIGMPRTGEE